MNAITKHYYMVQCSPVKSGQGAYGGCFSHCYKPRPCRHCIGNLGAAPRSRRADSRAVRGGRASDGRDDGDTQRGIRSLQSRRIYSPMTPDLNWPCHNSNTQIHDSKCQDYTRLQTARDDSIVYTFTVLRVAAAAYITLPKCGENLCKYFKTSSAAPLALHTAFPYTALLPPP